MLEKMSQPLQWKAIHVGGVLGIGCVPDGHVVEGFRELEEDGAYVVHQGNTMHVKLHFPMPTAGSLHVMWC